MHPNVDTYTIEWPPKPAVRPKAVWTNFKRGHHATFKETRQGKQRTDERRFVLGGQQ